MSVVDAVDSAREFLLLIDKKMRGIQSRSPIFFSYVVESSCVTITDPHNRVTSYPIDYSRSPSDIVYGIRQELSKIYPVAIRIVPRDPSVDDMVKLVADNGLDSLEEHYDAVKKESVAEVRYIVGRVDPDENNLLLERVIDDKSTEVIVYHMSVPVVSFLRRYCRDNDPKDVYRQILLNSDRVVRDIVVRRHNEI